MFQLRVSKLRFNLLAILPSLLAATVCLSMSIHSSTTLQAQRKFAPRVVQTIKPEINGQDVANLPMVLPGLDVTEFKANYVPRPATLHGQTRSTVFHRDVFQHEISFLPLRQLNVQASNLSGKIRDKNIWYLYYRVRNVGAYVHHKQVIAKSGHTDLVAENSAADIDPNVMSDRFFGSFELRGYVQDLQTEMYTEKTYSSTVSPAITQLIQNEEDPNRKLLDSVQLMQTVLERFPADSDDGGQWGVAVWYNVDPSLDFISVRVGGLTNAFRLKLKDDNSLEFRRKKLQLNFWRPGDGIAQAEDPIVYGIPLVDSDKRQIEFAQKRYHLPGPVIQGELIQPGEIRTKLIFEADAMLDDIDFDSAVGTELDTGTIPESILKAFANSGYELESDASVEVRVPSLEWVVKGTVDGEAKQFELNLHPEFWEKKVTGGIRFIKRLDHFWFYE